MAAALLAGCEAAPELQSVPFPNLTELETEVAEHLSFVRSDVESALAGDGSDRATRATAFGEAGMNYHAYAIYDAAIACYSNAEALAPRQPRWPYYSGRAYESSNDVEAAIMALERARALGPEYVPMLVALGNLQFVRETPELAEPLFLRALELAPATAAARSGLGQVAAHRRDWAAAVEQYEQALQIAPDASVINYQLGLAYRQLGRMDKAEALMADRRDRKPAVEDPLLAAVEALARGSRIRNNRGTRLFSEGKVAEALVQFQLALKSAPDAVDVLVNTSSALVALRRRDEALSLLNRVIELDPSHEMAYYNLGTLAARDGDDARAIRYYESALEADPSHTQSHFNLGNALRRTARFEEALPHYRRVVEDDPANTAAWLAEGLTLIRLHRWAEARRRLDEGVTTFPADRALINALVRVLAAAPDARVRDGARALALAERLLSLQRSLPYAEAYAMAAAEGGDYDLAIRTQEGALDAVRRAGATHLVDGLVVNLERYRAHRPCRAPWPEDDPTLSPRARVPAPVQD
jgi:tetratricopeptide (TPR) repeat protein